MSLRADQPLPFSVHVVHRFVALCRTANLIKKHSDKNEDVVTEEEKKKVEDQAKSVEKFRKGISS